MTSALKHSDRTPEQEACYVEARRIADEVERQRGEPLTAEHQQTLYLGTLHKRMREALEPINRAECSIAALSLAPRVYVKTVDGAFLAQPSDDLGYDREPFDRLRAPIIAAYTKGLM